MTTIMLCSASNSVIDRWQKALTGEYTIEKTSSISKMTTALLEQKVNLVLLHRPMVDQKTVSEILKTVPSAKVFMFTDRPNEHEGLTFLQLGVVGYANTYITAERLREAVSVSLHGRVWIGQKLMRRLIQTTATGNLSNTQNIRIQKLSQREREVSDLVSIGMTNLEIAFDLDISERTVKAHMSSIFQKTGTDSRLKLALLMKNVSV